MSILDTFFNVQSTLAQARAATNSFDTALMLTHSASWSGVRSYTDLDAVAVDFPSGTVEYLQASAFFSQDPHPSKLKIGKCSSKPTIRWAVTPVASDGATYSGALVEPNGTRNAFSYTAGTMVDLPYTAQSANFTAGKTVTGGSSGAKAIILSDTDGGTSGTLRLVGVRGTFTNGETITDNNGTPGSATAGTPAAVTGVSATVTEIVNGLRSKIDALGKAVTGSDQTTYLRELANTAGAWFALEVDDPSLLGIAMDHADPGYAADLTAIQAVDGDWYALLDQFPSSAVVAAVAAWAEARTKWYVTVSQDSAIETHALSGATDIAATLQSATDKRTLVLYRRRPSEFSDAGLLGLVMPKTPGSYTAAFKTIAGSTPDPLTDTQFANVQAKNANAYITFAGKNRALEGKEASGMFADELRFRDWQVTDVQLAVASACGDSDKLPMDNEGLAVLQSVILASFKRGIKAKGLRADPAPLVIVPDVADISDADKAARNATGITCVVYLASAIHKVNPLKITFTV